MGITTSKRKKQPIKADNVRHQESEVSLVLESCGSSSISANVTECSTSPDSDTGLETDTMGNYIPKSSPLSNERCDSIVLEDFDVEHESDIPTGKHVHFSRPEIESKVPCPEQCIEDPCHTSRVRFETNTNEEHYNHLNRIKSKTSESIAKRPPTPKRPEKFVLDNTAILNTGRKDIFNTSTSGGPQYIPLNSLQNKQQPNVELRPAMQHKSGHLILDQLGRQGILPPTAKTERTIDELRQAGMMIPLNDNNDQTAYIPSDDTPRRQAPRLIPLREAKLPNTDKKAPWERDVLQDDQNLSCCTPSDYKPPLFNSNDKSWTDDIMPLEVKVTNAENMLKIKVMDLDLL